MVKVQNKGKTRNNLILILLRNLHLIPVPHSFKEMENKLLSYCYRKCFLLCLHFLLFLIFHPIFHPHTYRLISLNLLLAAQNVWVRLYCPALFLLRYIFFNFTTITFLYPSFSSQFEMEIHNRVKDPGHLVLSLSFLLGKHTHTTSVFPVTSPRASLWWVCSPTFPCLRLTHFPNSKSLQLFNVLVQFYLVCLCVSPCFLNVYWFTFMVSKYAFLYTLLLSSVIIDCLFHILLSDHERIILEWSVCN